MSLDRVRQFAGQLSPTTPPPHPFDPLSAAEIEAAVAIIKKEKGDALFYNTVTLWEPRKVEMMAWLESPDVRPRPHRVADVVAIGRGSKVFDGTVDLDEGKLLTWDQIEGVQPLVSTVLDGGQLGMADLAARSQWRTSRSWSLWSGRIPRSLNNV